MEENLRVAKNGKIEEKFFVFEWENREFFLRYEDEEFIYTRNRRCFSFFPFGFE